MCDPKHEKPLLTGVIIRPDAGLKWVLKGKAVKELGAFCLQISLTTV